MAWVALRRAAIAGAVLFAATVIGPAPALPEISADKVDAAIDRVFDAGDYQRELPDPEFSETEGEGGDNPLNDPDWWRNTGETQAQDLYRPGTRPQESERFEFEIPKPLRDVLQVLLWILFVAGGALVAYYLLNEARLFARWKKGAWQAEETDAVPGAADSGAAGILPGDPDGLAARGDYAEAVHLLLLHSIMLIRDRGVALSTSLTSREILRQAPLDEPEKNAFKTIVNLTELIHFGGRGATEADFLHCRDLFRQLAQGRAGGAA